MKYFKRGWFSNPEKVDKIINEYANYYKTIESQLSDNLKQLMKHRHDTHIVKTYFENDNYIMELDEEIWGKAKFIFKNAEIKLNGRIEDEWWLYDEVYKLGDRIEIHILFDKSDAIILCDDAHIEIKEKEYFKRLNEKRKKEGRKIITKEENMKSLMEIYNQATHLSKEERQEFLEIILSEEIEDRKLDPIFEDEIIEHVTDKENICGINKLNHWEKLIFSFYQIFMQIRGYEYNNIEDLMINHYYNYSVQEKEEIYVQLFTNLEKNIINNIKILREYNNIIRDNDLKNIIEQLQSIYNKQDIPIKEKNNLYLKLSEDLKDIDFNKIYERILDCINKGLIK